MGRLGLTLVFLISGGAVAYAQTTFVSYVCADGTQAVAAFFQGDNRVRLQFDTHAYTLPQRLSASGARYAKSGVSFWIKGQEARLKRPKRKATQCKAQ